MTKKTRAIDFRYDDRRNEKREASYTVEMNEKKKRLIKESLQYPVIDIITFQGYRGDEVVEITTMDEGAKMAIQTISRHLGFEIETRVDTLGITRMYNAIKSDVYDLK